MASRDPGGSWDHPRSRGVYRFVKNEEVLNDGSSPLARGLPAATPELCQPCRIIPARAGFTCTVSRPSCQCQDHPRSRGVYAASRGDADGQAGSSPLARGLRRPVGQPGRPGRIIPARAGFTPPCGTAGTAGTDHPRSRGVYAGRFGAPKPLGGSSPLARGLPHHAPLGPD